MVVFLLVPSSGRICNTSVYEAIKNLLSRRFPHVSVRDGDMVSVDSDLFASLDRGFAVLAHEDPRQLDADYAEIRHIERAVRVKEVPL